MKILQLANKFPFPARDGGSIATLSLTRSFAALGHEVTVLAMNTSKHFSDPETIPDELKRHIHWIGVPVDTTIRPVRLVWNYLFSDKPYNAERFVSAAFSNRLEEILGQAEFDIILMEGLYLAPYTGLVRKMSRGRLVMRAHNIEHEIWERSARQQRGLKRFYFDCLARRVKKMELGYLNRYDAVLPITARDGEMLKKLGCRLPMHVVPTGVDTGALVPDHSAMEFPSVFHIGALDWTPNVEGLQWFFDRVWPQVIRDYPGLTFYLAGRNATAAIRHARWPNVVFLGEVDDAYQFMRSKAVMIVPVLSGSGMRIKIVEGMALGKTIVTTTTGTEGIHTTHGENILIADSADSFARSICEMVSNQTLFGRIGENACTFVRENYDNLAITASCTEFFQRLT